jgi:hypothetical protein
LFSGRTLSVLLATAALLPAPIAAQGAPDHLALGKMWTFENPPLGYLEKEYGFKPDQKWLDSLRMSALRLGERENPWCSAAFVSPQGLIMTNHHCVRDQVGQIQGENDWIKDGYAATALENEVKIPGLTVQQLVAQEDVTVKVEDGIGAFADAATAQAKREANIEAIKQAADAAHPGHMHQVVALYQGAVHQLYRYRVFDDLRLVLAVNLQTAHYGGDPDNFTYPRWSIDFSFLRAYENDKPADTTANYFRWRQEGARENELVFVAGNPGNTNRLLTVSQLECQRDVEYPLILEQLENGMKVLKPFADRAPGILTTLLSWENSFKAISGMHRGLLDEALLGKKREHERHFRAAVQKDAKLTAQFGGLWEELQALSGKKRTLQPKVMFYAPSYSPVIERAVAMAKAFDASLDEAARKSAREEALGMQMMGNALTQALLLDHFERAEKWLGGKDPYVAAVAGKHVGEDGKIDWKAALRDLSRCELSKGRFVKSMLDAEDGAAQWAASDDLGARIGRVLWPLMRDTGKQEKDLEGKLASAGARIGRALFVVFGTKVSPDATMTLRFSDGLVKGYEYNGTVAPWATTFYGLYGRAVEFGGEHPFDLAAPWVAAQDKVDLRKKVCFASTNDIVGGNSGSSIVDKDLNVVGLIFDGNIESLPNDFYYTQDRARAVSVHTDAIVEAMSKVYGMQRIVDELRAGATK